MRFRVRAGMLGWFRKDKDTVTTETPASIATIRMLTGRLWASGDAFFFT
jgi:hypothetical protein